MREALAPPDETTLQRMQRQRTRDTQFEVELRRRLWHLGLRYRIQAAVVPGASRRTVDILISRHRVAVFVDGCFWHGCPQHFVAPQRNGAWWLDKIKSNGQRDRDTDRRLEEAGWTVVRIWEHESLDEAVLRVQAAVNSRAALSPVPRPTAAAPVPEGVHGTINGYSNYRCRCESCRRANSESQKALIARYRETGGRGTHGTNYRYSTGCRCPECRAAHAQTDREYRSRRRKGSR